MVYLILDPARRTHVRDALLALQLGDREVLGIKGERVRSLAKREATDARIADALGLPATHIIRHIASSNPAAAASVFALTVALEAMREIDADAAEIFALYVEVFDLHVTERLSSALADNDAADLTDCLKVVEEQLKRISKLIGALRRAGVGSATRKWLKRGNGAMSAFFPRAEPVASDR